MRALISVSDKTGVIEFARQLVSLGIEIISTGGTETALKEAGISVLNISDITGFPECLEGRVKTLHPPVHAGLLAKREEKSHMDKLEELGIKTIDIVAVNLYPFKQTILKPGCKLEDAIENIDIGGPTMLRSAAKNYKSVSVVIDPEDYELLISHLKNGAVPAEENFRLAAKVFEHTAAYDSLIAAYMREKAGILGYPKKLTLTYELEDEMRYGENPHQSAAFYREPLPVPGFLAEAEQLNGKKLSFNNINDSNGALELLKEFSEPTVIAVKHANPCGVGSGATIYEAYMKAYEADKVSIFGGIVAANGEIDEKTAEKMNELFLEIIIAPSYTEKALEILTQKKNLRVLKLQNIENKRPDNAIDLKKVTGGLLVQGVDNALLGEKLDCVTDKKPTDAEMEDLIFAWKLVKFVKSNGIAIAKNGQSVGMGGGQTNRIWACKQAIEHGMDLGEGFVKGAALASDAFFPMEDCVQAAAEAGITAIIQPGGSVNDQKSIDECNKHGIAMVFTGIRHFRH